MLHQKPGSCRKTASKLAQRCSPAGAGLSQQGRRDAAEVPPCGTSRRVVTAQRDQRAQILLRQDRGGAAGGRAAGGATPAAPTPLQGTGSAFQPSKNQFSHA